MKKAIAFFVVAIVILACAFVVYSYYTPDVRITIGKPADANVEGYLQQVMVGVSTKLGLPLPRRTQADIREFALANEAVVRRLTHSDPTPMQVSVTVEVVDGQTVVHYSGTASTPAGDIVKIDERLVFDFVLTHATDG